MPEYYEIQCESCRWRGLGTDLIQSHPVNSTTIDPPTYGCPICGCDDMIDIDPVTKATYQCTECGDECKCTIIIEMPGTDPPAAPEMSGCDAVWKLVGDPETEWRESNG